MKIVILDGFTLNPGDLSWAELEKLGDLTVYDRTAETDTVERASGARIILTNKTVLSAEVIAQLDKLKYIGVLATGYNVLDLEAAGERGIIVTNVPAYATPSVVQMVFAHLLNLTHHVAAHAQTVREGKWSACEDFCYWDYPLVELSQKTMGIIGTGRIGKAVAKTAIAFGMKVIAYDKYVEPTDIEGITFVELDEVFRQSDVVSLHCPLTAETQSLVDKQRLAMMKPGAFLINTGRGPLVDENALADALNSGQLAGAGLDVLSTEPPDKNNPLLTAKNCFITPHIAWASKTSRQRLLKTVIENAKAFIEGKPQNVVN